MLMRSMDQRSESCIDCPLYDGKEDRSVHPYGSGHSGIMIVGEAPGREEAVRRQPFVGRSGKLLMWAAAEAGFEDWNTFYITNIVKCRPPGNSTPHMKEINACSPHLIEELNSKKPWLVMAFGRTAAQFFSNEVSPFMRGLHCVVKPSKLRRNDLVWSGFQVLYSYHPAYILRQTMRKGVIIEPFRIALELSEQHRSE